MLMSVTCPGLSLSVGKCLLCSVSLSWLRLLVVVQRAVCTPVCTPVQLYSNLTQLSLHFIISKLQY